MFAAVSFHYAWFLFVPYFLNFAYMRRFQWRWKRNRCLCRCRVRVSSLVRRALKRGGKILLWVKERAGGISDLGSFLLLSQMPCVTLSKSLVTFFILFCGFFICKFWIFVYLPGLWTFINVCSVLWDPHMEGLTELQVAILLTTRVKMNNDCSPLLCCNMFSFLFLDWKTRNPALFKCNLVQLPSII